MQVIPFILLLSRVGRLGCIDHLFISTEKTVPPRKAYEMKYIVNKSDIERNLEREKCQCPVFPLCFH
jgi:hypothetical protein